MELPLHRRLYLPEVAILLFLAVVPDLIQATYMTWAAVRPRRRPPWITRPITSDEDKNLPVHAEALR